MKARPLVGERNDAQVAVFIARVVKPELLPADSTLGARLSPMEMR